jgi:5-methylcytosine-specific restriction protein B
MPELKNVRLDEWTGHTAIDIGSFGPRLVTELNGVTAAQTTHGDFVNVAQQFTDNAGSAKLIVSHSNALRLVASMLAKRFVILTGLSGSGKTKLAHAFAAWITESEDQYRLVAVGADWTTNENVVGYQDAFQAGIYRKPSNGALDVILRAENDPARPYFLILDEMNLSHVERYFADILSAVESGEEIALHSSAENLKTNEDDALSVPPKIRLPDNLFIVGTVNVDETTYMFSPKVLDRANVIEFRASADDIAAFLEAPSSVDMTALASKGAAFGSAFVAESSTEASLDDTIAAELKARLTEIFGELAKIGAEFGFRTAYEITRFTHFHAKLAGNGWQFKDALDAQVLQKLLPKLHGSERRLGPALKALEAFCTTHECDDSLKKIRRMQDRLKDGFTSFAEA